MEQPNFFGLSIAYDPYKRELVDGKTLTTCGGDGGCNVCGGMGPLLGYLPCSPHCKPEVGRIMRFTMTMTFSVLLSGCRHPGGE